MKISTLSVSISLDAWTQTHKTTLTQIHTQTQKHIYTQTQTYTQLSSQFAGVPRYRAKRQFCFTDHCSIISTKLHKPSSGYIRTTQARPREQQPHYWAGDPELLGVWRLLDHEGLLILGCHVHNLSSKSANRTQIWRDAHKTMCPHISSNFLQSTYHCPSALSVAGQYIKLKRHRKKISSPKIWVPFWSRGLKLTVRKKEHCDSLTSYWKPLSHSVT